MRKIIFVVFLLALTLGLSLSAFNQYQLISKSKDLNVNLTKSEANYEIKSQEINYFKKNNGFLAQPNNEGNYPGIIMIHEWWGLNDNIKEMAKQLAGQGYIVLAVDLFGSVATTPDQARAQVSSLNQEEALQNMIAAKEVLQLQGANKIGSLGWCFGGAQSLQISLNQDLDATVIYYGNLVEDKTQLSNLKSPVLGIFGDKDNSIPLEKVQNFEKSLNELGFENSVNIYEGVGHAFANPSGQNYAPDQTKDAWNKTLQFLNSKLK
jgi:carboxymethylenebutenolidase